MKLAIIFYLFIFALPASAQIFSSNSDKTAMNIQGTVTVNCPTSLTAAIQAVFQCRDNVLEPSNFDYFLGPEGLVADQVTLTVISSDASSRTKSFSYNSLTRRTALPVNLWSSSPFQKALLKEGVNDIQYRFTLNGAEAGKGHSTQKILRGAWRTCADLTIDSEFANDCAAPYSVCQRYFEKMNYCR